VSGLGVTGAWWAATVWGMGRGRSAAVAARQRALEKLLAGQQERLERLAAAAVEVAGAHGRLCAARVEAERLAAESAARVSAETAEFRARVSAMLELGLSLEEVADLAEVDLVEVRAVRRGPKAAVRPTPEPSPAAEVGGSR
jgi:hypothetical protein